MIVYQDLEEWDNVTISDELYNFMLSKTDSTLTYQDLELCHSKPDLIDKITYQLKIEKRGD